MPLRVSRFSTRTDQLDDGAVGQEGEFHVGQEVGVSKRNITFSISSLAHLLLRL